MRRVKKKKSKKNQTVLPSKPAQTKIKPKQNKTKQNKTKKTCSGVSRIAEESWKKKKVPKVVHSLKNDF